MAIAIPLMHRKSDLQLQNLLQVVEAKEVNLRLVLMKTDFVLFLSKRLVLVKEVLLRVIRHRTHRPNNSYLKPEVYLV